MYCHDLEVMSSSPDQVELGVRGTSVLSRTWTKKIILYLERDRKRERLYFFIAAQIA